MRPSASRTLASCIAALLFLVFGTPLCVLWMQSTRPWWLVYALWASTIAALYATASAERGARAEPRSEPPRAS